jgi:hypothetical protein
MAPVFLDTPHGGPAMNKAFVLYALLLLAIVTLLVAPFVGR